MSWARWRAQVQDSFGVDFLALSDDASEVVESIMESRFQPGAWFWPISRRLKHSLNLARYFSINDTPRVLASASGPP